MLETATKVLKKIEDKGYKAYFVGGYPRDLYLNQKSVDVDICTNATPKDLKLIFPNINLSSENYGSISLVFNNIYFEITTFRKEIKYENNRIPVKIKYIDDLLEDLKRRDFIINTLCMDSNGNMIDLLGAREDLDAKQIRMVGKPKHRLKEDILRILRAIRFATTLNFALDKELEKYIAKYGYLLRKLSYERKKEELDKIFSSCNIQYGIDLILKTKLDKYLEIPNLAKATITSSPIGIWSQLDVVDIYRFNNNEKKTIKLINELMGKELFAEENLYKYGLYISTVVGEIKGIDRKKVNENYNQLYITNRGEIAITAIEICEIFNSKPGPFLKPIIDDIECKLVKKEIINDKDVLKDYVINNYS
ncbi:MAG: hypothetical protein PHW32_02610 [Bacilli bacterium]|nr:hypothetical protein [Bacilli bacterium]MDD4283249.1 hypothetical protein [Bacilli bacterium]MDD4718388.1 hypothetical protein [Bacilli bacterium]